MTNIYLTSTLHNNWNLDFNPKIIKALEDKGFSCYSPVRDTNQQVSTEQIFSQNIEAMKKAQKILAICENETPNFGVEVGYAHGMNIPIIILADKNHEIPVMIKNLAADILKVKNLEDINDYLEELIKVIKK